jgi:hypothetical protein
VVGAAAPGGDGHLEHRDDQPGADHQGERENDDVEQPQRPAESFDFAGECRGGATVGSGYEQPAGDGDACGECGQDRSERNGLPEHDRGARRA